VLSEPAPRRRRGRRSEGVAGSDVVDKRRLRTAGAGAAQRPSGRPCISVEQRQSRGSPPGRPSHRRTTLWRAPAESRVSVGALPPRAGWPHGRPALGRPSPQRRGCGPGSRLLSPGTTDPAGWGWRVEAWRIEGSSPKSRIARSKPMPIADLEGLWLRVSSPMRSCPRPRRCCTASYPPARWSEHTCSERSAGPASTARRSSSTAGTGRDISSLTRVSGSSTSSSVGTRSRPSTSESRRTSRSRTSSSGS
jgi:hypothetical protein